MGISCAHLDTLGSIVSYVDIWAKILRVFVHLGPDIVKILATMLSVVFNRFFRIIHSYWLSIILHIIFKLISWSPIAFHIILIDAMVCVFIRIPNVLITLSDYSSAMESVFKIADDIAVFRTDTWVDQCGGNWTSLAAFNSKKPFQAQQWDNIWVVNWAQRALEIQE